MSSYLEAIVVVLFLWSTQTFACPETRAITFMTIRREDLPLSNSTLRLLADGNIPANRLHRPWLTTAKSRATEPGDIILIFRRTKLKPNCWLTTWNRTHGWIAAPERCSWILPFTTATSTRFASPSTHGLVFQLYSIPNSIKTLNEHDVRSL